MNLTRQTQEVFKELGKSYDINLIDEVMTKAGNADTAEEQAAVLCSLPTNEKDALLYDAVIRLKQLAEKLQLVEPLVDLAQQTVESAQAEVERLQAENDKLRNQ